MRKENINRSGVGFKEKEENRPGGTVEGTDQCEECQRFMRLGEAGLCLISLDGFQDVAEIVGWIPGKCDMFIKEGSLFDSDQGY